jgi:hypothetical protein
VELRSLDTHAVEGGHVDDVEAVAPVHEHLKHLLGAEEWGPPQGGNPRVAECGRGGPLGRM